MIDVVFLANIFGEKSFIILFINSEDLGLNISRAEQTKYDMGIFIATFAKNLTFSLNCSDTGINIHFV